MKKYISKLKKRRLALGAAAVVVASGAGIGLAATTSKTQTDNNPPQVKAASTSYVANTSKRVTVKSSNSSSDNANSTDTSSDQNKTDDSAAKPVATAPTPSPSLNPVSPPPAQTITSLYLGQPYFDDNSAPSVTFTVPVTAGGSGNVSIAWVQDIGGATVCSTTVAFATNESKEVNCTASLPTPPQGVWATAASGTAYAKTATLVYIGGSSW